MSCDPRITRDCTQLHLKRNLAFALTTTSVRRMNLVPRGPAFCSSVRLALCLVVSCGAGAHLAACSSDDATGTGVSRSSDDDEEEDGDRVDANGNQDDPDQNDEFTLASYYAQICDYYTRCSTALRSLYGDKDQCAQHFLGLANQFAWQAAEQDLQTYWDMSCIRKLASLDCPVTPASEREAIEVYLTFSREVYTCFDAGSQPCTDDDSCLIGRCSAGDDTCGVCEPLPDGQCRSSYDCASGEVCSDGECTPPRATGSPCELAEHCASGYCRDSTCGNAPPEGGACDSPLDCGGYLWCHDGKCARPGVVGSVCDADAAWSCQLGNVCYKGTCQAVGHTDVAIGGLCAWSADCVKGAMCSVDSVCEATGNECAADAHCPTDEYCDETCLPRRELGAVCETPSQCKSGYCSDADVCAEFDLCE